MKAKEKNKNKNKNWKGEGRKEKMEEKKENKILQFVWLRISDGYRQSATNHSAEKKCKLLGEFWETRGSAPSVKQTAHVWQSGENHVPCPSEAQPKCSQAWKWGGKTLAEIFWYFKKEALLRFELSFGRKFISTPIAPEQVAPLQFL